MIMWSAGCPVQEVTINGGTNVVLTANGTFAAFDPDCPITVLLTGTFSASSTGSYAFDCGDLSGYTQVDITVDSGCNIYADGGNGGNSSNGAGGAGGTAVNINSANSSAILSFTNDGAIRGGGGGGGGGRRYGLTHSQSGSTGGKSPSPTCTSWGTVYGGGGGGGGGQTGSTNTSGGARTTSTAGTGCTVISHGVAGSAGTVAGAGGGGARGGSRRKTDGGSTCSGCNAFYGWVGGAGGAWGVAGSSAYQGAGGAAGKYVTNRDHCTWTNNGTVSGGYTA